MYQTSCVPCYEFGKGYDSDLGVDHWIAVKVILSYLRGLTKYFFGYGGDKEFTIKSYVDVSFTPIQMTLSLNLDAYGKWEQLARVAPCRALQT